jgi:adenine nucleotide transporter 17
MISTSKCSGSAGIVSAVATNPFWVLKTKQAQNRTSIIKAGKDLVNSEGFFALWKGLAASLILVSNPIIQFGIYEWLKKKLPNASNLYIYCV